MLSSFIPEDERIVTIEDAVELQLQQEHVVRLESRPPNIEGKGEITIRDLVRNSLRMRPDRIVVGECRGGESLDMLQAMNTGHDGSLSTVHANSPRDAIARLETLVLMAGMDLPLRAIREQIASAVDVIVQLTRLRDGTRRVTHVTEVQGMEGETVTLQDAFLFDYSAGVDAHGKFLGKPVPTGVRPRFTDKFDDLGHQALARASSARSSRPADGAGDHVAAAARRRASPRSRPRCSSSPSSSSPRGRPGVPLSRLDPSAVAPPTSAFAGAGAAAGAAVEKVLVKRGRAAAGAAALERAGMSMRLPDFVLVVGAGHGRRWRPSGSCSAGSCSGCCSLVARARSAPSCS